MSEETIDPRIRRVLRTRDQPGRIQTDVEIGRVERRSIESARRGIESAGDETTATMTVLVEFATDQIPGGFLHHKWIKISERVYSVALPLDEIGILSAERSVVFIESSRSVFSSLDSSIRSIQASQLHNPPTGVRGLTGAGVVVGIIDDGFDFTLDDFRKADGKTRVAFLWDQNLTPRAGERSPRGFDEGVEYDSAAIDRALSHDDPFSIVRHDPGVASHGTHVAGIAAGNGRSHDDVFPAGKFIGAAPEATIIFVQPGSDPSGENLTDSVKLAQAMSYIYDKAEQLGLPCVINMSLGASGGSHDGESVLERALDIRLQKKGRAFVKSAGNMHHLLGHASGRLRTGQGKQLRWEIPHNDRTQNEIEIWYRSVDKFKVRLTNPLDQSTSWLAPGSRIDLVNDGSGNAITIDSKRFTKVNGDALIYIEVSRAGTLPISPGSWLVELEGLAIHDGRFDAWIERDRSPFSQFAEDDFDPISTLTPPGTLRYGVAVANCDHRANPVEIAASSGRGRTRDGRAKPEITAPGTDIVSSCSMGGRPNPTSGRKVPVRIGKTGTSMAAPHVAGAIALLLQKNPSLSATQIRAILIASADREDGAEEYRADFGFGVLNAERAAQLVDEAVEA